MRHATIIDAGVGNLGNLRRALVAAGTPGGIEVEVTSDPARVAAARCLLLPGVGAFRPPRERLRGALEDALRGALARGAFLLGICVGYQLLFESSDEYGETDGLALLPGRVRRLPDTVPLPHIGWNRLRGGDGGGFEIRPYGNGDLASVPVGAAFHAARVGDAGGRSGLSLLSGLAEGDFVYFVHSYAPFEVPEEYVLAWATHGARFAAVARRGRVFGTQFHPEKSARAGLRLLANYLEMAHGSAAGG